MHIRHLSNKSINNNDDGDDVVDDNDNAENTNSSPHFVACNFTIISLYCIQKIVDVFDLVVQIENMQRCLKKK